MRDLDNRMLAGVCAGIAKATSMPTFVVRILWAVGTFLSVGLGIVVYLVMALVVPAEGSRRK